MIDNQLDQSDIYDTTWIESLALDEINMEQAGVINFDEHLSTDALLEESSISYVERLREFFEIYVTEFNEYRGQSDKSALIKIFKISNTINDFMLFRNSLKLVIARKSNDLINIGFLSNTGSPFAARTNKLFDSASSHISSSGQHQSLIHELRAEVGPFNDITWRYSGHEVRPLSLVRHYLTEFIKHSAR